MAYSEEETLNAKDFIDQLDLAIKMEAISHYKEPRILMNDKDLSAMIEYNQKMIPKFNPTNPTFKGIKIETRTHIEQGAYYVYDNYLNPFQQRR